MYAWMGSVLLPKHSMGFCILPSLPFPLEDSSSPCGLCQDLILNPGFCCEVQLNTGLEVAQFVMSKSFSGSSSMLVCVYITQCNGDRFFS